ncbi:aminoimidazole riboside kinase [Reticulibacter mediterranei]|uniref:Aminoimidazole riboside kinase n=1 Tax=Reticulibacter mediterranei TaxID=2778369 RepID=A0A8J3IX23_9CHLR|nr:sugar kinase [Reticulibacter mediterranei]GHP00071.1 aminoimidazole riboside kinase [Reticulibacter mediterranei]
MKHIDVLAIGEALIDFISDGQQASLVGAQHFTMYPGGAVTNVAINVARLGGSAALAACVGEDASGAFLRQQLQQAGVMTEHLHTTLDASTTLAVVARNDATPDFAIYRGADIGLTPSHLPLSLISAISLVHTSAFALSREPLCSTVLEFVAQAHAAGCMITFDPNYHPRIWGVPVEPEKIVARLCPFVTVVKPSLDDCIRLFGAGQAPEVYATRFLDWGAEKVVLTMGADGVLLVTPESTSYFPAQRIEVVDVTGAGDSFWAGLLMALLDGYNIGDAIRTAQAVAALKLQQTGPLSHAIDRLALYRQLDLRK